MLWWRVLPRTPCQTRKTAVTARRTVQGSQGQCAVERVFEDAASEIITISPPQKRTILYITVLCLNMPSSSTVRACFCTSGVSTPEKRHRNTDFPIFAPSRGGKTLPHCEAFSSDLRSLSATRRIASPSELFARNSPEKKTTKARSPFNKGAKPRRREASSHKSPSGSSSVPSGRGFFFLSLFLFSSPGRNDFSAASSSPPSRSSAVSDRKFSSVNSM